MGDRLAEDWHGRYWYGDHARRWREAGLSRPTLYTARCSNLECLWSVVIERRRDGWWWTHDDEASGLEEHGPFDHWQEAAHAAVEAGVAIPRR